MMMSHSLTLILLRFAPLGERPTVDTVRLTLQRP